MTDVIIVGGGIMGLLTARELARAGRETLLLDKGRPGGGTTWASAGIVSPHGTSGPTDAAGEPGLRLRTASYAMWPALAEAIREESGTDIELRLEGVLLLATGEDEAAAIRERAASRNWGETRWLDPRALREEEPALARSLAGALRIAGGNLEVRRLGPALEIACRRAGAEVRSGQLVEELWVEKGRVRGVRTIEGDAEAPVVVVCAGIGSRAVAGARPAAPVVPQRGQMVALDGAGVGLRHTLLTPNDPYLVPRSGGRIVLGATREFAGEDPRLTAGGLAWLLGDAIRLLPALREAAILETWTGFRPVSPDYLPLIGPGEPEGLFFCTGHGPSGIGPAPASARLAAALILGDAPPLDPAPYDPRRFG